jgi:hypothetical protein
MNFSMKATPYICALKDNHVPAKKMKNIFTVSKWWPKHCFLAMRSHFATERTMISIEW